MIFNLSIKIRPHSTRHSEKQTAGFIPPFEVLFGFLMLRTAGTNLIHTKELLEEVDDFEEEACYAALVTVAGAIVSGV